MTTQERDDISIHQITLDIETALIVLERAQAVYHALDEDIERNAKYHPQPRDNHKILLAHAGGQLLRDAKEQLTPLVDVLIAKGKKLASI